MTTKNDLPRMEKQADSDGAATASTNKQAVSFTPGPWRVEIEPSRALEPAVMVDEFYIATVHDMGNGGSDTLANARLIAAATELLVACKEALLWYGPDGDHVGDPARPLLLAAIAKAERGR